MFYTKKKAVYFNNTLKKQECMEINFSLMANLTLPENDTHSLKRIL